METLRFQVPMELEGERLDICMNEWIDTVSRSYLQKLIKEGYVKVNSKTVKPGYSVKTDDEIIVCLPKAVEPEIKAENIPLDILYEDKDVLVVNKPKGMVVHPAAGHYEGTLVNALMYHCKDDLSGINGVMRPGIVHRIDRDTTGSLIVCKNDFSHNAIAAQLKEHSIKRIYKAIIVGNFPTEEGTVNAPIGRHPSERKKMAIVSNGREAITHYKILEPLKGHAYAQFQLETGRTHQIRVHMASQGHPLLGDTVYGSSKDPYQTKGQVLHAQTLGFVHPRTGEYIEVNAPLPEYFEKLLVKLR
ncbi:MAG: RluA family pseudouridine synthase [Lachnospiraceae bacterium]|nr:RluA family pseudouridine synthase [Lachnospiraceae bacterium]